MVINLPPVAVITGYNLATSCRYKWLYLATGSCRTVEQFIVVERTSEFFVQANVAVLWNTQSFIATGAVQATRLGNNEFHIATAFAAPVPNNINCIQDANGKIPTE